MTPTPKFWPLVKYSVRNSLNFKGRARQSELCHFYTLYGMLLIPISILEIILGRISSQPYETPYVTYVMIFGLSVPFVAILVRRAHDIGQSGKTLLVFMPFLAGTYILTKMERLPLDNPLDIGSICLSIVMIISGFMSLLLMSRLFFEDGQKTLNIYGVSPKYSIAAKEA